MLETPTVPTYRYPSRNQWSGKEARKSRMPPIAASEDERQAIEDICLEWRVNMAELSRAAWYLAGVYTEESLEDLPAALVEHVKTHRTLVPPGRGGGGGVG